MKHLFFALCMIFSINAFAQDPWKLVLEDESSSWSYHAGKTKRVGIEISSLIRYQPKDMEKLEYIRYLKQLHPKKALLLDAYSYSLHQMKYDCSTRKAMLTGEIYYSGSGKPILELLNEEPSSWQEVSPDTIGDLILATLCKAYQ